MRMLKALDEHCNLIVTAPLKVVWAVDLGLADQWHCRRVDQVGLGNHRRLRDELVEHLLAAGSLGLVLRETVGMM